jgi:hypothetical protein
MNPSSRGTALRLVVLAAAALPALTGFPLEQMGGQWLPGLDTSWLIYGGVVHLLIWALLGRRVLADVVTVAALIAAPVVFGGACVASLAHLLGMGGPPSTFGSHYVSLAVSILTVVPLALALVAAVPFHRLELALMTGAGSIRRRHKVLLMALRVFNHIVHGVVPLLLEVVREEGRLVIAADPHTPIPGARPPGGAVRRLREWGRTLIQMGVAAICLSVQYIPLWAMEIAALPEAPSAQPRNGRMPPPG